MEESGGAQQQQRFLRREEELTEEEVVRGGDEPQQHAQRRVNDGVVREESSEVTAVEGHSDMLFDAATYASESHLMDRYRNRIGPIFEDVLRNVHARFLAGYKNASTAAEVIDHWEACAWSRRRDQVASKGGLPTVHYHPEPPRRVRGAQADMMWSFVENLVMSEMPAALDKASGALSEVMARVEMVLGDAATNARELRRAERTAADERLEAMRVSYESRLRELGARHHADVEAWKRRELNKVRDAAVAEVRRVQLDADRLCGEAEMQARVSQAQSDGLMTRVREIHADAAEFAAVLARSNAVNDRRAADGVRRMRAAKKSRAFHAWRLAVERSMLGVRVETLTCMLYDSQDNVKRLKKELQDQDAEWEQRIDAVSKMAKCRDIALLTDKCGAAIRVWSRRARRTAGRCVIASCVLEERPTHPKFKAFKSRVLRQKSRWRVGGLTYVEARWKAPRVLDPRRRIVHNAASSGRLWLMFSRWRRVAFFRHLQTIAAAETFGRVAMKIIAKRWLQWATVEGAARRAEAAARREAAARDADEAAKKSQAMVLLAGKHNRRCVLMSKYMLWRAHVNDVKQAHIDKLKLIVSRMRLYHASAAIHKWSEGIMISRANLAAQRAKLWSMRMGRVVLAWRVWAQRSADPLTRAAVGAWQSMLHTGAKAYLQPWLDTTDALRLTLMLRAKGPTSVWRERLWEKVVPGVHPAIRSQVMEALRGPVLRRPILLHFRAWREWASEIFKKTRSYQMWFRKTLPCRRALTAWADALERRRRVEILAAAQFPMYRSRRVLRAWWLVAAEGISRGPPGGNTATAAAVREEKGQAESAAAWVSWESRGRPIQHWLGRLLTIAANIPWHRSALAVKESGPGATAAQLIDSRMAQETKQLIERAVKAGRGLNRDRDAHHGALGVHHHSNVSGSLGSFGSRPRLQVKMRNTEGDALRVLSDALEHVGDIIASERASADARVAAALNLANESEDRERRRRQITMELFHQRGEMSRAARAVAAVKAAGDAYDVEDAQHQQAVQHIVRMSSSNGFVERSRGTLSRGGVAGGGGGVTHLGGTGTGTSLHGTGRFGGTSTFEGKNIKNINNNTISIDEDAGGYDVGSPMMGDAESSAGYDGHHRRREEGKEANTGRPLSAIMFGQEFTLPPPGESRSWMEEEESRIAASRMVDGRYVGGGYGGAQQRVSTAPAGMKRGGLRAGGGGGVSLASSRTAGSARGGTLRKGAAPPPPAAASAANVPAHLRPSTAGPRTAAVMASQHGGGGGGGGGGGRGGGVIGGGRPATSHGTVGGGGGGGLPTPGAVTGPLMSRAEALVDQQRRGLEESRKAIASLEARVHGY